MEGMFFFLFCLCFFFFSWVLLFLLSWSSVTLHSDTHQVTKSRLLVMCVDTHCSPFPSFLWLCAGTPLSPFTWSRSRCRGTVTSAPLCSWLPSSTGSPWFAGALCDCLRAPRALGGRALRPPRRRRARRAAAAPTATALAQRSTSWPLTERSGRGGQGGNEGRQMYLWVCKNEESCWWVKVRPETCSSVTKATENGLRRAEDLGGPVVTSKPGPHWSEFCVFNPHPCAFFWHFLNSTFCLLLYPSFFFFFLTII